MPFSSLLFEVSRRNRPFASLNLGGEGSFSVFDLCGWILTNLPVFGSLGGMCFGVFCGCGTCPLSSSTIAIFAFLALFCSFSIVLICSASMSLSRFISFISEFILYFNLFIISLSLFLMYGLISLTLLAPGGGGVFCPLQPSKWLRTPKWNMLSP